MEAPRSVSDLEEILRHGKPAGEVFSKNLGTNTANARIEAFNEVKEEISQPTTLAFSLINSPSSVMSLDGFLFLMRSCLVAVPV